MTALLRVIFTVDKANVQYITEINKLTSYNAGVRRAYVLDCLQRFSPKAVKAFNNAEFLFLAITALYKLPSDKSSHSLMAKYF